VPPVLLWVVAMVDDGAADADAEAGVDVVRATTGVAVCVPPKL